MKSYKNIYFLLDILIVIVTFVILYFIKYGVLLPEGIYLFLFIVHISYWLLLSSYHNKYSLAFVSKYKFFLKSLLWSTALALFFTTSTVALTDLRGVSRLFILKMTIIPMIVEIVIIGILRSLPHPKLNKIQEENQKIEEIQYSEVRHRWVVLGASMLLILYFIMIRFKTGEFYLYPWSERILLILFGSWIVTIFLTKKYSVNKSNVIYYLITPFIKSGLIMLLMAAMVYFFFRIESLSRFLLFGTILVYTLTETVSFLIYFIIQKEKADNIDAINIDSLEKDMFTWNLEEHEFDKELERYKSLDEIKIRSIFDQISSLEDKNQIIDFLDKKLKKLKINFFSSAILSTITVENIEILRNKSKNLLINLHKLNDIRYLNQYLITCHQKLIPGGLLVGYILPIDTTYHRLQTKMPKLLFTVIYPFYFVINRVIPKIPKISNLYFFITQAKNRAISKAEMYGRLNFCGFIIENEKLINDKLYFIAKKVKTISTVANPSYHPIVKLKRIGLNGKFIYIYKFRTMFPYSEFLQEYVYELHELTESGNKFENDFRITNWGKLLRILWMDELPQIFNWLRGDLNLVGVRALSEQYFNLYPKEHQEFRIKFKPGLIPPFYVDLPKSFEDKILSEKKYLEQKLVTPIKTDIIYGLRALTNIIFKGARSS